MLRKKGANIFNTHVSSEDIRTAKVYGIRFIRLALDKFPSKNRDFLMGDADHYRSLDPNDLISHPERLFNGGDCPIAPAHQRAIQKLLFNLNNQIISAIRTIDPHTPIVIDSSNYADLGAFEYL
ncbi:MAG: hypothetical protein LBF34_00465 [Puniceicoccales bacterium]|nr:hypothetical protein [Puniceicoccales bacterium]